MGWDSSERVDVALRIAADRNAEQYAADLRRAGLLVVDRLGRDSRDVLEALGIAPYDGYDIDVNSAPVGVRRTSPLTTCWRCGQPKDTSKHHRPRYTGLCRDCSGGQRNDGPPKPSQSPTRTRGPGWGWQDQAECRKYEPELWYDTEPEGVAAAKGICWTCPVKVACLEFALARPRTTDTEGVFGGLTPDERLQLRGST